MLTKLDSALNQEWLSGQGLRAAGTPEGAKKGWDTRGRGRKSAANKVQPFYRPNKTIARMEKGNSGQLTVDYAKWGKKIDMLSKKLDEPDYVHHTAVKFLHFLKRLGEWVDSFNVLRDFGKTITEAAGVVFVAVNTYSHFAPKIHSAVAWAYAHVVPLMNHIKLTASL